MCSSQSSSAPHRLLLLPSPLLLCQMSAPLWLMEKSSLLMSMPASCISSRVTVIFAAGDWVVQPQSGDTLEQCPDPRSDHNLTFKQREVASKPSMLATPTPTAPCVREAASMARFSRGANAGMRCQPSSCTTIKCSLLAPHMPPAEQHAVEPWIYWQRSLQHAKVCLHAWAWQH